MLFITILYSIVLFQLFKAFMDPATAWYREPKFWLQLITLIILTGVSLV
jgi:hypothetical protein